MKKTTIAILPDVRTYLTAQKRVGESVDETLRRLLNLAPPKPEDTIPVSLPELPAEADYGAATPAGAT